jgi:hypothetical protein
MRRLLVISLLLLNIITFVFKNLILIFILTAPWVLHAVVPTKESSVGELTALAESLDFQTVVGRVVSLDKDAVGPPAALVDHDKVLVFVQNPDTVLTIEFINKEDSSFYSVVKRQIVREFRNGSLVVCTLDRSVGAESGKPLLLCSGFRGGPATYEPTHPCYSSVYLVGFGACYDAKTRERIPACQDSLKAGTTCVAQHPKYPHLLISHFKHGDPSHPLSRQGHTPLHSCIGPEDLGALLIVDSNDGNQYLIGIATKPSSKNFCNPSKPFYEQKSRFLRLSALHKELRQCSVPVCDQEEVIPIPAGKTDVSENCILSLFSRNERGVQGGIFTRYLTFAALTTLTCFFVVQGLRNQPR